MNAVQIKRKKTPFKDLYRFKPTNVLIVGGEDVRDRLLYFEQTYNIVFNVCSLKSNLKKHINSKTIAIIIDEKFISQKGLSRKMTGHGLPVFYLSRKKRRASYYNALYELGIHGVINWPSEDKILGDFLIESLKPKPLATGKSPGDKRLSKAVKSHLILGHNLKSTKVNVFDGFVFLKGKVENLYTKEAVEEDLSGILGVKKLILKDLQVRTSKKVTSKELERRIKLYAGSTLGENRRTLLFKVKDNILTIKGDVENMSDFKKIVDFCKRQKSLIKIINDIKFRPSLVKKRSRRAKLIEDKAKDIFDGVKFISIAIYDTYAEVSGTVLHHADRILVERYLLQMLPVTKVINKLYIVESSFKKQ